MLVFPDYAQTTARQVRKLRFQHMTEWTQMTEMRDTLVARLAALPPEEQDRLTEWLLEELTDEELWGRQFSTSQNASGKLARGLARKICWPRDCA